MHNIKPVIIIISSGTYRKAQDLDILASDN